MWSSTWLDAFWGHQKDCYARTVLWKCSGHFTVAEFLATNNNDPPSVITQLGHPYLYKPCYRFLQNWNVADRVPVDNKGCLPAFAALTPIHTNLAVQYQMCILTQLPHVLLLTATLRQGVPTSLRKCVFGSVRSYLVVGKENVVLIVVCASVVKRRAFGSDLETLVSSEAALFKTDFGST